MTEIVEGIAVIVPEPPEQKEEEIEKEPIKIRIALFFDGTLNNRLNIEAREDRAKAYTKKTGFLGFFERDPNSNSYDNGRTNINIMEKAISESFKPEGIDYYASFYIEGQGTFDLKEDSTYGYAFGAGASGVRGRANQGVKDAYNYIIELEDFDKDKHYIEELTFDVFGFSRGAATARYAIYQLLKSITNMHVRLKRARIQIEKEAITVGFAGLYDTVLSYMVHQRWKLDINLCEQESHTFATKTLHLASAEEHRVDFPVHDISKGSGDEFFLPGVHSDVGGSYNMADEEKIRKESDPAKQRALIMLTRNETDLTIFEGDLVEVIQEKENLREQGWYIGTPENRTKSAIEDYAKKTIEREATQRKNKVDLPIDKEFTISLFFSPPLDHGPRGRSISRTNHGPYRFRYAALTINRVEIKTGYSNIPLKIMAKYAKEHAKLTFTAKLLERADTVIDECNLGAVEDKIKKYLKKKPTGSAATDWLTGDNNKYLQPIRHEHLNFSAKCKLGYKPRIVDGKRVRYIFNA